VGSDDRGRNVPGREGKGLDQEFGPGPVDLSDDGLGAASPRAEENLRRRAIQDEIRRRKVRREDNRKQQGKENRKANNVLHFSTTGTSATSGEKRSTRE